MSKTYSTAILFRIDGETLKKLDSAANELGHSRSLFIRDAIRRRISDHDAPERTFVGTAPKLRSGGSEIARSRDPEARNTPGSRL